MKNGKKAVCLCIAAVLLLTACSHAGSDRSVWDIIGGLWMDAPEQAEETLSRPDAAVDKALLRGTGGQHHSAHARPPQQAGRPAAAAVHLRLPSSAPVYRHHTKPHASYDPLFRRHAAAALPRFAPFHISEHSSSLHRPFHTHRRSRRAAGLQKAPPCPMVWDGRELYVRLPLSGKGLYYQFRMYPVR